MLQYYHHEIKDEGWKFELLNLRVCKTSSWIQSADEMTLGIGLVLSVDLILSIRCKSKNGGVLSWAKYITM